MNRRKTADRVNREVLRAINADVTLRAQRLSTSLLAGLFRAVFLVEQSYEYAEPEVFTMDDEAERIDWSRLDAFQLRNLSLAIANEEVTARRFQEFSEYDFILILDCSRSMMLGWWDTYGSPFVDEETKTSLPRLLSTKLYLMKYVATAFLHAAAENGFRSLVKIFGGNVVKSVTSAEEPHLRETILEYIDNHFIKLASSQAPEEPRLIQSLREVLQHRHRCIVLCISDFLDCISLLGPRRFGKQSPKVSLQEMGPLFGEISRRARAMVFHVNDIQEERVLELSEETTVDTPFCDVERWPGFKRRVGAKATQRLKGDLTKLRQTLGRVLSQFGLRYGSFAAGAISDVDRLVQRFGLAGRG